jgi:hypothetical protein
LFVSLCLFVSVSLRERQRLRERLTRKHISLSKRYPHE